MTPATLALAIMAVRPETPQHLAIAIAVNSMGYGASYEVAPELIAMRMMRPCVPPIAAEMPRGAEYFAKEAVGLNRRYAKPLMAQAAKLRALAKTYPSARYGAE